MDVGGRPPITVETLRADLTDLPASQASAARVLQVAEDERSSGADLADAVSADPVLTAQVMRLANSAYYGLSRRVAAIDLAVGVVGFETIRSLAAASAAGVLRGDAWIPDGFWEHAAATAIGSSMVGARVGMRPTEAFSMGLLHDLGAALLCGADPGRYRFVEAADVGDHRSRARLEREYLGLDHAEVGGVVLEDWHFPPAFCEAIATHHDGLPSDPSVEQRVLAAGQVLASLAELADDEHDAADRVVASYQRELVTGAVEVSTAFSIGRQIRTEATAVASIFSTPDAGRLSA